MMRTCLPLLCLLVAVAGCAYDRSYEEANRMLSEGKPVEGLAKLEQAVKDNPRNTTYRAALIRERERVAAAFVLQGDSSLKAGNLDLAAAQYQEAKRIDPDGFRANAGLQEVERARRHAERIREAQALLEKNDYPAAESLLRAVLAENPYHSRARELLRKVIETAVASAPPPSLSTPYKKPITLEFRDAQIKTVFEMLSRTSGINFVFDRDVKADQKITVFVRNTTLEDVLKLILTTNQLDRKVLNENSVLIYPNTPAKQKDYRDLVVRSFYLSNADVKQASAMVKAMMKTQDVFIDEKLNLMVVKDTPEVVRLTDQLIRTLDLAEPEVMLEVEVLEVARTRLQEIGVRYPGSVNLQGQVPGTGTAASTIPIDSPMIFTIANPALVFNLRASVGTTNILANPRIRVKNKEKARIHIGDKVPVFTSTATANVGVSTSVSYLDVGIKLDVESQVYLQDEVGIKVGLEVSNIVETITVSTGTGSTIAYRLGTRNANTVLQLRDGETQILAGLISDEDRRASQRIPGLGDIPMLSRLFGSSLDNRTKTEVILMITPRIVRNLMRPEGVQAELAVGTDNFPGMPSLRIAKTAPGAVAMAPASGASAAASPTARDVPPIPASPLVLGLSAPDRAQVDKEFSIEVKLPSTVSARAVRVDLQFDSKLLQLVEPVSTLPGMASLTFAAETSARSARFKVLPGATGPATIQVSDVEVVDRDGYAIDVSPPPPVSIQLSK